MMSDDKTIIEKALAQTDAAIASAKELAAICDKLQDEKNNLAAQNAMLHFELKRLYNAFGYMRRCYNNLDGEVWNSCELFAITALNATQADVDAWKESCFNPIPAQHDTF